MALKRSASPAGEPVRKRVKIEAKSKMWDIEFEDNRDLEIRLEQQSSTATGTETNGAGSDVADKNPKLDLATCTHPRSSPTPTEALIQMSAEVETLSADDYERFEASTCTHVRSSPTPTEVVVVMAEDGKVQCADHIDLSEAMIVGKTAAASAAEEQLSELVVRAWSDDSEVARLPRDAACRQSEVIQRMLNVNKEAFLIINDPFYSPELWEAISSWLRGERIVMDDMNADRWYSLRYSFRWDGLSSFLRQYRMERLLNELSDILRSSMLSRALDASLWTGRRDRGRDDLDATVLLTWLSREMRPHHGPLEKIVKEHLAYHMAHTTPAARALTSCSKYQDMLKKNLPFCAELSLLQYSNNGAGPKHPSGQTRCHFHTHNNGQNSRISFSSIIVNQSTLEAVKDLLGDAAKAHLTVESNICPGQSLR